MAVGLNFVDGGPGEPPRIEHQAHIRGSSYRTIHRPPETSLVSGTVPSQDLPTTRSNFQVNAHQLKFLCQVALHKGVQLPCTPALNPVECFFRALR